MQKINSIKQRKKIIIGLCVLITVTLIALFIWSVWANTALELNTYTVTNNYLPDAFEGFRIAQVSDLHNAEMGENNENLITMLEDARPDIIAITGDLIDSHNTNIMVALNFVRETVKIAPCYYVTGNHEASVSKYEELKNGLIELG